jgi:hypothetical protein
MVNIREGFLWKIIWEISDLHFLTWGALKKKKVSKCGKMLAKIRIGNDELNELLDLKGF